MPQRILFLCTGNICRSASAELLTLKRLEEKPLPGTEVMSAGVWAQPGRACPSETVASLSRRGVDARHHRARAMTPALINWADIILGMTEEHCEAVRQRYPEATDKTFLFRAFAGSSGDVGDPFGGGEDAHNACTAEISLSVDKILKRLR